jgi:hypothetical protein
VKYPKSIFASFVERFSAGLVPFSEATILDNATIVNTIILDEGKASGTATGRRS